MKRSDKLSELHGKKNLWASERGTWCQHKGGSNIHNLLEFLPKKNLLMNKFSKVRGGFDKANSKSSSALEIHSLIISASTIEDFAFFDDTFYKRVSHLEPSFKFFGTVDEKVHGNVAINHLA